MVREWGMSSLGMLREKFRVIWPLLNERTRRLTAAHEALQLGYGGVSLVHRASGLSRKAIGKGISESEQGDSALAERIRREKRGGKRRSQTAATVAMGFMRWVLVSLIPIYLQQARRWITINFPTGMVSDTNI